MNIDAHGLFKGSNTIEWALRLPDFAFFSSSPRCLSHLGMFEGKGEYPELKVLLTDCTK